MFPIDGKYFPKFREKSERDWIRKQFNVSNPSHFLGVGNINYSHTRLFGHPPKNNVSNKPWEIFPWAVGKNSLTSNQERGLKVSSFVFPEIGKAKENNPPARSLRELTGKHQGEKIEQRDPIQKEAQHRPGVPPPLLHPGLR